MGVLVVVTGPIVTGANRGIGLVVVDVLLLVTERVAQESCTEVKFFFRVLELLASDL